MALCVVVDLKMLLDSIVAKYRDQLAKCLLADQLFAEAEGVGK